ncbi:lysosome membrane protein 2-like isoform X1 [Ruditapes philippinarum]|uniref:lysosome membrane protein 2-like isoform X1 n=2 Tax=Ruditapes philippinarum TaxID=129788 RepID=UPI00295AE63A|nr:lysosome membrane protein 2-like isoform X1 [Ruditapes philippinarum]
MKRQCCCLTALFVVGFILLIAGVAFIPASKSIIHNEINEQINLKNKATKDNWVKNPTPIKFQIWAWNLTNPDEVKAGTGKPTLVQRGPYTYIENRQKVAIKYNDDNKTVTYRENKFYSFDRANSNGTEADEIVTVNIPLMLIANVLKKEFGVLQTLAAALLDWANEDLFVTLSIKDLVWGYDEPLINKTISLINSLGFHLNISDKFGIFVGTNGTDDGVYNIMTGEGDSSQFGIIKTWNFAPNLTFWTSHTCNMLNGTDGTIFHPFMEKSDVLYVFSSDLCRSIYFTYLRDNKQKGIDVYRFTTPPDVFQSPTDNPANQGYCTPSDNCFPSGLLNVENCHFGAPLIFSQPHFLNADPAIIHGVNGMHPNLEEHGTFIDVEPYTGAAFYAAKKLQINILLEKVDHIEQTNLLKRTVLPVLWLNESSRITDSLADEFKSQLATPLMAMHIGTYVAIGLGSLLILVAIAIIAWKKIFGDRNREMTDLSGDRADLVPGVDS